MKSIYKITALCRNMYLYIIHKNLPYKTKWRTKRRKEFYINTFPHVRHISSYSLSWHSGLRASSYNKNCIAADVVENISLKNERIWAIVSSVVIPRRMRLPSMSLHNDFEDRRNDMRLAWSSSFNLLLFYNWQICLLSIFYLKCLWYNRTAFEGLSSLRSEVI